MAINLDFKLFLEEYEISLKTSYAQLPFTVFKNPTPEELQETIDQDKEETLNYYKNDEEIKASVVGKVRGIMSKEGNIYIWPEGPASHKEIAKILRLNIVIGFYYNKKQGFQISENSSEIAQWTASNILNSNEYIKKMLGKPYTTTLKSSEPITIPRHTIDKSYQPETPW